MNITIKFRVLARKYYQHRFKNVYYYLFYTNEKNILKKFIENFENLKETIRSDISTNSEYHGIVTINNINIIEQDNKLYIIVDTVFTNEIDNYTADKIKKIIRETYLHYFNSGDPIDYTDEYYYTYETCDERQKECVNAEFHKKDETKNIKVICPGCPFGGISSDHEHDFDKCSIKLCGKDESEASGEYEFGLWIEDIDIENADYYNKNGTNKSNFIRKCAHHNYYLYLYDGEDLLHSECLQDEILINSEEELKLKLIEQMIPMHRGAYNQIIITDKDHNILYKFY